MGEKASKNLPATTPEPEKFDPKEVESAFNLLKNKDVRPKCPITGKPVEAVLLNSKEGEQAMFCAKCMIMQSGFLALKKNQVILYEDLLDSVGRLMDKSKQMEETFTKKDAQDLLKRIMDKNRRDTHKAIEEYFESSMKKESADLMGYIDSLYHKPDSLLPNDPVPANLPEELRRVAAFYKVNSLDRKKLLEETTAGITSKIEKVDINRIDIATKMLMLRINNNLLYENKYIKIWNPEVDVVNRLLTLQPLYTYSGAGNLSFSFKVDQPTYFFGFAVYQAQQEYRVRFTISQGEVKTLNAVIREFNSTLKVEGAAINVSSKQTARTSAELFDVPILLEAGEFYNISMNAIDHQNFNMHWGNGCHPSCTQQGETTLASGTRITFKNAADDNCGNGMYAHIYADLFLA